MVQLLVINALIITGIYVACNYEYTYPNGSFRKEFIDPETKQIGWRIKFWLACNTPQWLFKPLIGCIICMASIHSTYVYWFCMDFTIENLVIYPFYILALAGLNSIVKNNV